MVPATAVRSSWCPPVAFAFLHFLISISFLISFCISHFSHFSLFFIFHFHFILHFCILHFAFAPEARGQPLHSVLGLVPATMVFLVGVSNHRRHFVASCVAATCKDLRPEAASQLIRNAEAQSTQRRNSQLCDLGASAFKIFFDVFGVTPVKDADCDRRVWMAPTLAPPTLAPKKQKAKANEKAKCKMQNEKCRNEK
ncbi:MAG: hypothetical protein R3C28_22560 [Pirellulaceae bacterium]